MSTNVGDNAHDRFSQSFAADLALTFGDDHDEDEMWSLAEDHDENHMEGGFMVL